MSEMIRFFNDPSARHAMLVHIPIALAVLGVLPAVALAATRFRNVTLKAVCVAVFAIAAGGAVLAENAGHAAEEAAEHAAVPLTEAQEAALHEHEELGENGWMWPGLTALVFAATFIPKKRVAPVAGAVGIAASVGVLYWASVTGHAGGRLVYEFGVGAPSPGLSGSAPAATRDHNDEGH